VKLLLDERILSDGRRACTWATLAAGKLRLDDDAGASGELSLGALDRVMCRYGRPLEDMPSSGDALELPNGRRLRRMRHHAPVDATGRDYLVWERPNEPPLAVLATHATAALRYLLLRVTGEKSAET
jgi:hypothetical protein